jgi:hypothetical protein
MEELIHPKEFQKIASVKLASLEENCEWCDFFVDHGEMKQVFIPPSFIICAGSIMGYLWTKTLLGEIMHTR